MSDPTLDFTVDPPTVSTAEVQGNFEKLRDFLSGAGWIDSDKYADASITEAKNIAGATGLAKGCFSAYRNAALSVTSGDVVIFDAEEWDVSSWYDVATGRFTPLTAGYYRLDSIIHANVALTADKSWAVALRKNGTTVKNLSKDFQRGSSGLRAGGSALVVANGSTDYFDIKVEHDNGGTVALSVGATNGWTYFQGELVGRS